MRCLPASFQNPGAVRARGLLGLGVDPAALGQHAARALTAQDATRDRSVGLGGEGIAVRRRILVTMLVAALAVLLVPQGASAGKPGHTCPPAFDLGGLTIEQVLQLPNVQAGLAAGVYDETSVREFQEATDRNDDGVLCFQSFPTNANPASLLQYYYNVVDNNASVPSG